MISRRIPLLAVIAGGGVWLLAPGEAGATGPEHVAMELRYEREAGAEACASEAELRAAVAARLGYDPFVTREGLDLLVVRVRKKGARIEGTVERTDHLHHRRGKATTIGSAQNDCSELGASLAVAISVAVDPLSFGRETVVPEPALTPLPPLPATPTAEAPRHALSHGADPPSVPTKLVLAAGPSVSTGALPGVSFGVRAAAGVVHGMFELDVEGRFDPPVRVPDRSGAVEASLVLATLLPCVRHRFALACAQLGLGALRGSGLGFDHTREANTFYATAGARLGAELPLGDPWALRLWAEGQVPLRPTRLETDGAPVWSTPAFALSVVPTLVGRFP